MQVRNRPAQTVRAGLLWATASDAVPTSLLLYPATAEEPRSTRLRIRRLSGGAGAEIVGIGLPIAALLKELTAGTGETPLRDVLARVIDQSFGILGAMEVRPDVATSAYRQARRNGPVR